MSCCAGGTTVNAANMGDTPSRDAVLHSSQKLEDGRIRTVLALPDIHCGGCIRKVEGALSALPELEEPRVNLSTRRVVFHWKESDVDAVPVFAALRRVGYEPNLISPDAIVVDDTRKSLFRALAVAGFAAGNIMLLSVSVWSGADDATRDLFHWISALIAIPTVGYAGRVFFRPALRALAARSLNMDVPISLAILLATGMSIYETWHHGAHAYFDASVSLLFFLLIGRTLDHMMRERARDAVAGLARITPEGATVIERDGSRHWRPLDEIEAGMRLHIAAGDRIPVDATVREGKSDIDAAIATGESVPIAAREGATLSAGMLNLTGPLVVEATKAAKDSFLSEMLRMLDAAEGAAPTYRKLADRAAAVYAPVVHLAALFTFLGWIWVTGDWRQSLFSAIAVLIITCPCALGLAVPIVQVVAASRLFRKGIMVRDGTALEKLAQVDHVVFDKTGTLTVGMPRLRDAGKHASRLLGIAAALGANSRHPYSQALARAAVENNIRPVVGLTEIREIPGEGIEATLDGDRYFLGRSAAGDNGVELRRGDDVLDLFRFEDRMRANAAEAIAALERQDIACEILSGDNGETVAQAAHTLGMTDWRGELRPADKIARVQALQAMGHKVLMVGDGLNDTPSLAAADVSMVPSKAADIGRQAAGLVFLHEGLDAVTSAVAVAHRAQTLIRQNFALAVLYNLIAIPLAVLGYASPLVAALAMSGSSIIVILNALRLNEAAATPFSSLSAWLTRERSQDGAANARHGKHGVATP